MTKIIASYVVIGMLALAASGSAADRNKSKPVYATVGSLESLDPQFNKLIAPGTKIEKLADGFQWCEGPVWLRREQSLLFSDIPRNVVLQWKEGVGLIQYLKYSGYTGSTPRGGELGSNALLLDNQGRLVLCQQGDRCIARQEPNGKITVLVEYYDYRRFNSPNDAVYRSNGDLYFTDPPYGLEKRNDDPRKELMFNGVFRLAANGHLDLLIRDLNFPNGIAFSPDEKTLYIANSDPDRPIWMAYPVKPDGSLGEGRVFFDASSLAKNKKGLPDGMKVDKQGNLFAAGPGGVLVFTPAGKHLGTINTGDIASNCAWGNDGSELYITSNGFVCRIKTLTKGKGF